MGKEQELRPLETLLREYDRAVEWHSYRLHDVDREAAQHRAAAKLAEAVRADLAAPRSSSDEAEVVAWAFEMRTTFTVDADGQRIWNWKPAIFQRCPPKDDDCVRNVRPLYASPSGVKAGVTELLDAYEAQVKLTPLGHENIQRGRSTYNWKMSVIAELRALAAIPTPPIQK